MPGIGGTGVVTISRVVQMAALIDGRHAAGVEQTGLSQKGGPVVSDVRISTEPIEGAVAASRHSVDLLLGFDLLGAASPTNLAVTDPERTIAVVSSARVATAAMVRDHRLTFPALGSVEARIDQATGGVGNAYVNAEWIAERLFGDHLAANMVLLGAAYQHGCLPLTAVAIERAIELNGTASESNITAFRWGRAAISWPDAVSATLAAPAVNTQPVRLSNDLRSAIEHTPETLGALLTRRAGDLVQYQDERYARQYLRDVTELLARERELLDGDKALVASAYASALYKLMAYKDEYEVARLHLDDIERRALADEFGDDARVTVLLHPPILRAIGLRRKIGLRRTAGPAFRALRRLRFLRGRTLDPFGHSVMRRTERRLIDDYRSLMSRAMDHLRPDTLEQVLALAELPDMIRGYESIKETNITRFGTEAENLLASLESAPIQHDRAGS